MSATRFCITSAAQHLICAVIHMRSQFEMIWVYACRIVASVTNNHTVRYQSFVHDVRSAISHHRFLVEPKRTSSAFAVSRPPKPASITGYLVFIMEALLCWNFRSRINHWVFPRPMSQVMLSAKPKSLMLSIASFDRTFPHNVSHSVSVIRDCITTPKTLVM